MRVRLSEDYMQRERAMAVPGSYWDSDQQEWAVDDPSPMSAAVIIALFPDVLAEEPWLIELRDQLWGSEAPRPVDYATQTGIRIGVKFPSRKLYDFQDIDAGYMEALLERDHGAFIGWSRGLGKTTAAAAIIKKRQYKRVVVVSSNTAKQAVWAPELEALLPEYKVVVIPNLKEKREAWLKELPNDPAEKLIILLHYESLAIIAGRKGRGDGFTKLTRHMKLDAVVFDEVHRLASMIPGSKRNTDLGRATMKLRRVATDALALSGTAIMNKGDDLFGPLHFLYPDRYSAKYATWNDRVLETVKVDGRDVVIGWKPDRLEDLRDELGVIMVYRTKEDELDLPLKTEETITLDLSPKQRRIYDDVRDQFWSKLDEEDGGGAVKTVNILDQMNTLRRIATGLDEFGVADSTKLDYAMELIEDNEDEVFVVFSWYKAPLRAVAERLEAKGIGHFLVDGDVKPKDRAARIAAFMGGEGRVFLGTLSTLGESVNLQRAQNAIFLDRAWNPAVNDQAEDRIYRIGQEKPVTITHLVARDTVDELRVQPVLASKKAIRRALFGS